MQRQKLHLQGAIQLGFTEQEFAKILEKWVYFISFNTNSLIRNALVTFKDGWVANEIIQNLRPGLKLRHMVLGFDWKCIWCNPTLLT